VKRSTILFFVPRRHVLILNSGSSSLKFALFAAEKELTRVLEGKFERIGLPGASMLLRTGGGEKTDRRAIEAPSHAACVPPLVEILEERASFDAVIAAGHRVVHGGLRRDMAQRVTGDLLSELRRSSPLAPEHLPAELGLMDELGRRFPELPQVACFDTAFHRDMPKVARLLPLPRRYFSLGVHRYGFHGLSYTYLLEELERVAGREAALGRVVLAHLGNGASMAAVRSGKSIDTTMSFTPAGGLVMSTRSGDLDPGIALYLARSESMTADGFHEMVNSRSGLLGISETSPDVRDLLSRESSDERAADAIAVFCYQARKWVGSLAAALGGLDTLVFSGGIGENSAVIRSRICEGLAFIGIELDSKPNEANAQLISSESSRAIVRVFKTDEEMVIARATLGLLFPDYPRAK